MSLVGTIGFGALAVLISGWLFVSFSRPGSARTLVEWLSACAMYLALLMLFTNLSLKAHAGDNLFALLAFACLAAMSAFAKVAGGYAPTIVIVFVQNLICFVFVAPVALRHGFSPLKTKRISMHVLRAAAGVGEPTKGTGSRKECDTISVLVRAFLLQQQRQQQNT